MRNWINPFTFVLLCSVLVSHGHFSAAEEASGADDFFKAFTRSRDGIVALKAPFSQTVTTPDETIEVRGELVYVRPRRVIYRMYDPERITLVDDTFGYEYDAEIQQVTMFDLGNNPQAEILFMGFVDTLDTLREAYDLEVFSVPDEPRGSKGLEIRPKPGTEAESYFLRVRLYLRDQDYLPWRIVIRNDENTETRIEIGDINTDYRPEPSDTQIFLPAGTRMIENDRVIDTVGSGGKRVPDALLLPPQSEGTSPRLQPTSEPVQAAESAVSPEQSSPAVSVPPNDVPREEPSDTGQQAPHPENSKALAPDKPPAESVSSPQPSPPARNPKQVGGPKRKAT